MQGCDVTKTDDRFGDSRHAVDDTLQTIPAPGTEDHIHRIVMERVHEIRQTVIVRSGKPSPRIARVHALAHLISPHAQTRSRPVDIRRVNDSGGRYDADVFHQTLAFGF